MKILIVCAGDKLNNYVSLNILKYLIKNYSRKNIISVCVVDGNKEIIKLLKLKKIFYIDKNIKTFLNNIERNEFQWLLNIWGPIIYKKKILKKFKNNLNLHPSFLPYAKGKDPYVWTIQKEFPLGITIHEMNSKVDNGEYFIRKKLKMKFPFTGGDVFNLTLKSCVKEFIKNWPNILKKKIRKKKYLLNKGKIFKRKDLIADNYIDLDNKSNITNKNFVLKILSQDFKFNKMQIKLNNKIFDTKLVLKQASRKKWK